MEKSRRKASISNKYSQRGIGTSDKKNEEVGKRTLQGCKGKKGGTRFWFWLGFGVFGLLAIFRTLKKKKNEGDHTLSSKRILLRQHREKPLWNVA